MALIIGKKGGAALLTDQQPFARPANRESANNTHGPLNILHKNRSHTFIR